MKKILKILMLVVITSMLIQLSIFATSLTLKIDSDKEKAKVGDEVKIKVSWNGEMQAADFSLNYNPKKVEYISCNLDEVFVNNEPEKGKIKTAWVSLDDTNKTDIEYTFRIKKGGKAKFSTITEGGFATGKLEIPEAYNEGNLTIKVQRNYIIISIIIIFIIVVVIVIFKILKKKNSIRNRR